METLTYFTLGSQLGEIGPLTFVWSAKGLCRILFAEQESFEKDEYLQKNFPRASFVPAKPSEIKKLRTAFLAHLEGAPVKLPFDFDLRGTAFQKSVWSQIAKIPFGKTRTYSDLARACRKPLAARAVGQATGKNPLPILIACHRVLGAHGAITGFSAGLEKKKTLLRHEGIRWT